MNDKSDQHDQDCNPDWWKELRALSLKRKVKQAAKDVPYKPGDSFLIVTEGTVTEPVYFELVIQQLQIATVQVKVLPSTASDPRQVVIHADKIAKEQYRKFKKGLLGINEPSFFDHVWAIVDTDVATRNNIWNDVVQLANARKVKLADSTPCFEFWLLLHFGPTTRADLIDGEAAKSVFRNQLGLEKDLNEVSARKHYPPLVANWPLAVKHAEQVRNYHNNARTKLPANPSTQVDLLVSALNASVRENMRLL
jgi:hypothetical protein